MASGVSFVESVVFMGKETDYRYYEWRTLSSIIVFIDDEQVNYLQLELTMREVEHFI